MTVCKIIFMQAWWHNVFLQYLESGGSSIRTLRSSWATEWDQEQPGQRDSLAQKQRKITVKAWGDTNLVTSSWKHTLSTPSSYWLWKTTLGVTEKTTLAQNRTSQSRHRCDMWHISRNMETSVSWHAVYFLLEKKRLCIKCQMAKCQLSFHVYIQINKLGKTTVATSSCLSKG